MKDCSKLDKRTKEYKECIKGTKGLGDVIESITEATGIKKAVKKVFGDDCGCSERKEKLNKFRIKTKHTARCMKPEELTTWQKFRELNEWKVQGITINDVSIELVYRFYVSIFELKGVAKPCRSCSPKPLIHMIESIDKVYNEQTAE